MKPYNKVIKKTQMVSSIGIILGLTTVDLMAAPNTEQVAPSVQSEKNETTDKTESTEPSKQAKPAKRAKKQDKTEELEEIQVEDGRAKNLIGLTGSASQGEISQKQFEYRPMSRNGELVEVVPGALATQHSGSGKANQYFLRGFNLDHGTDFTTIVDGIQMNMPTHAHGQGYMDINSIIPELVKKVEYGKGPYYGEVGDFSAAGFAKMISMDRLDQGIAKFTAGSFDYYRTLVANSSKLGDGDLLYAGEFNLYNGVWQQPEDSKKFNGMLRYALDQGNWGISLNAKAYTNRWIATNQIAQANIDSGALGMYGTMNPTDGGKTNRYSFSTNLWNKGKDWKNDANIYALYYDVSLFSDFTGYLNGPLGDQINQFEHRVQTGGNIEHTRYNKLFGFDMDNTIGLNFRHDEIMGLGLNNTVNRQYVSTVSLADVSESTAGAFFKNETHWLEKLRTVSAIRGDFINNDVTSLANGYSKTSGLCLANPAQLGCYTPDAGTAAVINAANSGSAAQILISPKFSLIVGPWYDTEYFVNFGYGYHSNDARGTTHNVFADAANGGALTSTNGVIKPMAWGRGGEVGARSSFVPGLNSTVAFWWLESSEELVWQGDAGTTAANGKSSRYGVEWTNYYKLSDWLTLDADLALTTARFAAPQDGCVLPSNPNVTIPCSSYAIPNSVGRVVSAGATIVDRSGLFGTVRLRHFGDVALDNQGTWSPDTSIVNLGVGYKQKSYKLELDVFNLFDSQNNDISYAYASKYPANAAAQYGILKHPVEPRMFRGTISINF